MSKYTLKYIQNGPVYVKTCKLYVLSYYISVLDWLEKYFLEHNLSDS